MQKVKKRHVLILEIIQPGDSTLTLSRRLRKSIKTIRSSLHELAELGLIEQVGGNKKTGFTYKRTGMPYTEDKIKNRRAMPSITTDEPDLLLQNATNFELTEENWQYLEEHPDEPRSSLCKKLGLTRLQLNFLLDKGIKREAV